MPNTLTHPTRLEIEALIWPHGGPDRPPESPGTPPILQLATHDVLAAFPPRVRSGGAAGSLRQGPRATLRPALRRLPPARCAGRDPGRAAGDRPVHSAGPWGPSGGEVLAQKIRRYRSVLSRTPDLAVHVGLRGRLSPPGADRPCARPERRLDRARSLCRDRDRRRDPGRPARRSLVGWPVVLADEGPAPIAGPGRLAHPGARLSRRPGHTRLV